MGGKMVHDTEQTVPARAARYGMHRAARMGVLHERARQRDAQRKRDADAKANSGWPWWGLSSSPLLCRLLAAQFGSSFSNLLPNLRRMKMKTISRTKRTRPMTIPR